MNMTVEVSVIHLSFEYVEGLNRLILCPFIGFGNVENTFLVPDFLSHL